MGRNYALALFLSNNKGFGRNKEGGKGVSFSACAGAPAKVPKGSL